MDLKTRREAVGLTQEQVAKLLDVSQAAVSQWESGTNAIMEKYKPRLAKLYRCTVDEIEIVTK